MDKEKEFFKYIVPKVFDVVASFGPNVSVATHKGSSNNYATEVDLAVEKLLVSEILKRFPGDNILAEEEHSLSEINDERIWIIDPICGTSNLGKGLSSFCTNIALAINQQLVASLVIDHAQHNYFWSIGDNKVYINDKLTQEADTNKGITIDLDLGCLNNVSPQEVETHLKAVKKLLLKADAYMVVSLNTSLSFAYVAVGKIDGFINVYNHPWDIAAGSFLISQSGGIITDLKGQPWTLSSSGAIAAKNKALYDQLLAAYN